MSARPVRFSRAIESVIRAVFTQWALKLGERRRVRAYLRGPRRCMDFDVLSATERAAIDDITKTVAWAQSTPEPAPPRQAWAESRRRRAHAHVVSALDELAEILFSLHDERLAAAYSELQTARLRLAGER